MTARAVALMLLFVSFNAIGGNFATCILDKMPGVQNAPVAFAVFQLCKKEYPLGYSDVAKGSGAGWFGYDSGAQCTAKKAAETPNQNAAIFIRIACGCLYDPAFPPGQMCL